MSVETPSVGMRLVDARGKHSAVVEAIVGRTVFVQHIDRRGRPWGSRFTLTLKFLASPACGWRALEGDES